MPPKDPPVERVGHLAPTPAVQAITKRSRWSVVLWSGLGVVLLLFLLLVMLLNLPVSQGHGHGRRAVRVVGRLVWTGSEEPIAGVRVLAVPDFNLQDEDWDPERAWTWAEEIKEGRDAWIADGGQGDLGWWVCPHLGAGARSDANGAIEILTGIATTTYFRGSSVSIHVGEPAASVAALWIAPEGREPVLVRLGAGRFQEHEEGATHEVWGTYDIGTVEVPLVGRNE